MAPGTTGVPTGPAPAPDPASPSRVYPTLGPGLLRDLKEGGYRKLVLQTPAGLLREASALSARIQDGTGIPVVTLVRACFGACDPPSPEEAPGAEAIVTLGHAPIPNMPLRLPTYFVEMRQEGKEASALANDLARSTLPRRLGLVCSIQHLDLLPALARELEARGFTPRIGRGGRRLRYAGQALGCNYTGAEEVEADVDGYLFLGTGRFHPLGLAYAVTRPVWAMDPLSGELSEPLDREGMIRRRLLTIAQAAGARRWGILASSFDGQNRQGMAFALKARAEARGREADILVFDRLDPRDLLGRALDAYVSTACPRIALDDAEQFPRPILTPPEFLSALGERPLLPYRFDTYS
jgi:2-(3-amino-3-carboxypropyl)histidine synthase